MAEALTPAAPPTAGATAPPTPGATAPPTPTASASATAAPDRARNRWLVLVIACLAQFMVVLDATVVNVALPSIQHGLHFSASSLPWVVNAYTLIFGGFLLLGGRAGDLLGRKRLFMAGIALFSAASLLNGLAQTPTMLIVGRGLQGLGGALLSPAALSIITTTFTEQSERTKALGVWSAIAAGGGAVGLVLGGALTQLASWPWVFIVNVPVGVLTLIATAADRARVAGRRPAPDVRPGRRDHRDRRAGRPRLRDRQGPGLRLGLGSHGRADRRIPRAARRVRGDRAAQPGTADPPEHLPHPDAHGGRHRPAARRLGDVRDVLLRLAVRAGDPRLQPAPGRAGLPPGDRRHRRRRRPGPAADPAIRRAQRRAGGDQPGHGGHGGPGRRAGARHLCRRPASRSASR